MMRKDPSGFVEIESVEALKAYVQRTGMLDDVVVQGLDLRDPELEEALLDVSAAGAVFLGDRMSTRLDHHIRATGGTIFPSFEDVPFRPYRSSLYTPHELMDGYERGDRESLEQTTDGRIYAHFRATHRANGPMPVLSGLAYRIHDHAIDDALHDLLYPSDAPPRRVVGIMGGHRMGRDEPSYRQVAEVARRLTRRGYFVATGGGPGAMEAANLGAYLSRAGEDALDRAIAVLRAAPGYDDDRYIDRAYEVLDAFPDGGESLSIPTWFYGHEPSNLFSSHIAKYFANSLREDGLLAIARYGVIFAPGSAGTIQEIFMDAAQNHYASYDVVSPMIFFDAGYWTRTKPVYPLVAALADGRDYGAMLALCDDVDAVVDHVEAHAPVAPATR